ncbi:TetR/AcrR family transcriptional regulator [Nocardia stercoris]|uniref:TetR/AcrR family transcriptional regulator n=1 Tax=Nocardia stercoris TaxID=2483361 RepID=UPI001319E684|nr:TetR/AcrR family transcriptional regulator [Nocardia stercoris]
MPRENDTRRTAARILDVAERLAQTRGFNGFSYADIAPELGISKAALHYHYPGKGALGQALIERYAARFFGALAAFDDEPAHSRLDRYVQLYVGVLSEGRMCLCGMLAAEYATLPEPVRDAVVRFFARNEQWLESVLAQGRREGTVRADGSLREAAQLIISCLEGAMLIARTSGGVRQFEAAAANVLRAVSAI